MKYFNNENNIYEKLILVNLKLLILCTSLFVYKYVYSFRINQEISLRLFTIILFSLWILKILHNEEYSFEKTNLNLPILIFILLMTVSLLRSQFFMVSLDDYLIFLFYFLICFLIINNINNKRQFDSIINLFFITATIISIYALLQYYGFDPYLKGLSAITSTIGQKNWVSNYLALIFPIIFSYFLLENIKKNKLYYYLLLSIIYAALMICQSRGIWISIVSSFLIGIFLIYKYKIFDVLKKNKKWITLIILTFLLITIIYSTDNPLNKSHLTALQKALTILDEQDPSINTRLLIWRTTWNMIKNNPLFGLGVGNFKLQYLYYQADILIDNPNLLKYNGTAGEAHNEYLQIGAEMGLFGLGVFGLIIYTFYILIINFIKKKNNDISKREINGDENTIIENGNCKIKSLNKNYYEDQDKKIIPKKQNNSCIDSNKLKISLFEKHEKDKIIIIGLLIGITCFLIHSLFSFPLHVPALGSAFFIIVGLTIVYLKDFHFSEFGKSKIKNNNIMKSRSSRLYVLFTILIILIMILAIDSLVIRPYLAEVYAYKGRENLAFAKYNNALSDFEYAAKLDPYNGRILLNLGATYYNLGFFEEAEKTLQQSKEYYNDRNIYRNLGLCYMKLERFQEAEEEFKHTIYLDPKFTKAYFDLGLLYFQQEDYDKAIIEWNKVLEIETDFSEKYNVLYFIGMAYQKKEMPDKALEYFLQALQLVPEGDPIEKEIEEEINKIYKNKLED